MPSQATATILAVPEKSQTTISFSGFTHPIRPRPVPKPRALAIPPGASILGGINKVKSQRAFAAARLAITTKAATTALVTRDSDGEAIAKDTRKPSTRKLKLLAIKYPDERWFDGIDGKDAHKISNFQAAQRLNITPTQLRAWRKTEHHIRNQHKFSFRASRGQPRIGKEEMMDNMLFTIFKHADGENGSGFVGF